MNTDLDGHPSNMDIVDAEVWPEGSLEVLSQLEVDQLRSSGEGGLYPLLRRCMLAVLNSGSQMDDTRAVLECFKDFDVGFIQRDRGLKVSLTGAPSIAFVDGEMIRGTRELLFAVLRDIVFTRNEIIEDHRFDLDSTEGITNAVFHIVRNARLLEDSTDVNLVVCWGGHAIGREEYEYTKLVGYELGLRGLDVCTGCGPGAMKGPMKGATIGHSKQRVRDGRYIGITEPGIIAAESPNPIVNKLVIMPDMEKRLEAFVRVAHAIVVFPGGVGTAEELLFLLGILMRPENRELRLPLVLTGPPGSADYFRTIDEFIAATLGDDARSLYRIEIGDPEETARLLAHFGDAAREQASGIAEVREFRHDHKDAFYFNWRLGMSLEFQAPFHATHENMASLQLHHDLPPEALAVELRRAFSGLVAGNVKEAGIRAIEANGPFEIRGDADILAQLDRLLAGFVAQGRMKLEAESYTPCYRLTA